MLRLLPKSGLVAVEIQEQQTQVEQYRNSPLLKEAEEARDRLYRLQYVTTALSQAVTPNQISEIMVSLGSATLKASGSTVWLFDGSKELYLAACKGYTKEQIDDALASRAKGTTPTLDAIRLKKPIYLRSLEDRKKLYPNTIKAYSKTHKQSFIAIPLLIDESAFGVVAFAFDIVHDFTSEEKEFIFALVKQCSQALDRARLYDKEVQQREALQTAIDRVDSLQKVTAQLVKALTPSELGDILLEESMRMLKASAGEVCILSEDKQKLRIISYKGYPKSFANHYLDWQEMDLGQPMLTNDVMKSGEPLFVEDASQLPEKYKMAKKFSNILGYSSWVTLPLKLNEEFWGILSLYFKSSPHLNKDEQAYLDTLSFQFAQAYERARLYEEERKQKGMLQSTVARIESLQKVTAQLAKALTPSEMGNILIEESMKILKADGGDVCIVSKDRKKIHLISHKGYPKSFVKPFTEEWEDLTVKNPLLLMDVIRTEKPLFIEDVSTIAEKYTSARKFVAAIPHLAEVMIPLKLEDNFYGILTLIFSSHTRLEEEEMNFLNTISYQFAQAYGRAQIYNEEKKQKSILQSTVAQIGSLQKVTAKLAKALTSSEMGNILLEESMGILKASGGEVCILSEDKERICVVANKGYPKSFVDSYLEWKDLDLKQPLLMNEVIKTGKTMYVEDLVAVPKKYQVLKKIVDATGFRSTVLLPLKTEKELYGVLGLLFDETLPLTSNQIDYLELIAHQFAQAYGRAMVYEKEKQIRNELEYTNKRVNTLQSVTVLMSKAVHSEELGEAILKEGVRVLGASAGEIIKLASDKEHFILAAFDGYPRSYGTKFKVGQSFKLSSSLVYGHILQSGEKLFIEDLLTLPRRYKVTKTFVEVSKTRAEALVPVRIGSKVVGLLAFLFPTVRQFSSDERNFITALANQYSQNLDRVQIYEKQEKILNQLTQSEEEWKQLAENIPQLVWAGKSNGEAYYWSSRWEEYTGFSQDKLKTDIYWKDVVHPDDRDPILLSWKKTLKAKKPSQLEYRLRNKNGEYRWFLSTAVPVKNEKGEVIKWFGTETDIHDQKMASQEIEKREARFRALIENSSDAVVLMNEEGKILYSSPSTQKITGYSPEERQGKVVYASIYPKDKEKVKAFIHKLSQLPDDAVMTIQYRRINKDGSIPWMEGIGRNLLHNSNVGALVVNYHNITERIESEQAIQQSKEELEVILENVADAIVVRGADGHVIYCNQAAAELSKYASVEEFIGDMSYQTYLSRFESIFDEEGNLLTTHDLPVSHVLIGKKQVEQIIRVVFREDHTEQWRKVTAAPILDTQGNVLLVITVIRDITQEKEKEKTKDEFISTASHELKTPITSAKLYAGILSEKIRDFGDEKTYTMITKLDSQLDRLTKLINDLLDVTKMKSGRVTFTKVRIGVENFVKEIAEEMQYTTVTHKINVVGESRKILSLDKERIRQVMINMLTNAIKYSPDDDKVDVILKDVKNGVTICVRDYGVGIEKADQQKIFEPFYRASSQNEKFPGLGLGLHIAHEIVKRHGGRMWVESTVGHGTKMFVFLPSKS